MVVEAVVYAYACVSVYNGASSREDNTALFRNDIASLCKHI